MPPPVWGLFKSGPGRNGERGERAAAVQQTHRAGTTRFAPAAAAAAVVIEMVIEAAATVVKACAR